ncbi:MAG: carboxypeptidase-like regulatory domain-containing protein [Candidatus Xenobiia bacterium LiM19]
MTPFTLKGTVAGRVTDGKSGAALEKTLVFIGCTDCRSDDDGNYSLDVLAGYRLIFALKHGYDPYVDLILVTAAETLNHNIKMTPFWDTGQVKGFVTDFDSGAPLENVNVAVGSTQGFVKVINAGGINQLARLRNICAEVKTQASSVFFKRVRGSGQRTPGADQLILSPRHAGFPTQEHPEFLSLHTVCPCEAHGGEASWSVFASSGYRNNAMKSEGEFMPAPPGWGRVLVIAGKICIP